MKFIEDYSDAYVDNQNLYGYSVRNLFRSTSIYLMPMINPDGVNLVTGYFTPSHPSYEVAKGIADRYPWIPFVNGWKANIRGVDLKNHQLFCKVL